MRRRTPARLPVAVSRSRSAARMLCAVMLIVLGGIGLLAQDQKQAKPGKYKHAVMIRFQGEITAFNEHYVYRKLDQAKSQGADLVIVEITSPGGLLDESLNIAYRLRDTTWARTVAYVPQRAISGGAIMSLGCDDIVMNEHAQIGDAGAIQQDQFFFFREADAKTRTYLTGQVRTLAEAKGRPPLLAEAMVDKKTVLYQVRDKQTGEETIMSEAMLDKAEDPARWEKLNLIDESTNERYLQLSGRRAVELGLAQHLADDLDELMKIYQLPERPVVLDWGAVDTTIMILNHWFTSVLLIIIGLVALYAELASPGISVGGLIAGLCFVLFFWSHFMGGTSGWLEVILFLSGIVFLGVELFVIPGWGFAGVTGILLMISSLVLASQNFVVPTTGHQAMQLLHGLGMVMGAILGFIVLAMLLSRHMGSLPLFNRLILKPPSMEDSEEADDEESDGGGKKGGPLYPDEYLPEIGQYGVADSPLRPSGKVRFGEEYVDVVTEGTFVESGRRVRVLKVAGNLVTVREVHGET
ncbi:MAG: NfeD family protein [Pirellulaceae bacterium]